MGVRTLFVINGTGYQEWGERVARRINLESTMRPRGRQRGGFTKKPIKEP